MSKFYSEEELRDMGMDAAQIRAILSVQQAKEKLAESELGDETVQETLSVPTGNNVVQMHQHNVEVHTQSDVQLVPTSLEQIKTYGSGAVVELPSFADGQPFVARVSRPSLLNLIKIGRIPNTLVNQATSLFINGASSLNGKGKESISMSEMIQIIDIIIEDALLEPTVEEIRSVGMELTDDQLMALFAYTQKGVKALEQFRTE